MSDEQSKRADWLPSDVSVREAVDILRNPNDIDFYRFFAEVLDNTKALDQVTEHVDPELLVKEFSKIKNHMRHGKLDESNREFWEEKIRDLSRELGLEEEFTRSPSEQKKVEQKKKAVKEEMKAKEEPVPVDPDTFSVEDAPSSAADTGKTGHTGSARRENQRPSEMTGGVEEEVGFNEQVSDAAKSVSNELRDLRQKRDLTRNELAENSDLSLQMISEIERGRKELTYEMIQQYADALNMQLELDFQEQGEGSKDLLKQVEQHIDDTIAELDVNQELADHTRMILHQIVEDGLYRKRFATLRDTLNYLEEAVKQFSIRDDAPDRAVFSNEALFDFLKSRVESMEYSDLAFDENVKIVGQKVLERFHE